MHLDLILVIAFMGGATLGNALSGNTPGTAKFLIGSTDNPGPQDFFNIYIADYQEYDNKLVVNFDERAGVCNLPDYTCGKNKVIVDEPNPFGNTNLIRIIPGRNNEHAKVGISTTFPTLSAHQSGLTLSVHNTNTREAANASSIGSGAADSIVATGHG